MNIQTSGNGTEGLRNSVMDTNPVRTKMVNMVGRTKTFIVMAVLAILLGGGWTGAWAATYNLRAATGSVTMPDGRTVPIWGYADCGADPTCAANPAPTLPGPVLEVEPGGSLTVNVKNDLPEPTSFMVPGLQIVPSTDASNAVKNSYTTEIPVGGSGSFSVVAPRPGTFLYESASDQAKQVQMGLHGALIVRPTGYDPVTNRIAYAGGAAFAREEVIVLSDVDPVWHDAVYAGGTNTGSYNPRYFRPYYWLFNGKAYPETHEILDTAGQSILMRYINASSQDHSLVVTGLEHTIVAADAYAEPYPRDTHSVVITPGQTRDLSLTPPVNGVYTLFDRAMDISNGDRFPGGMITMVRVQDPAATGLSIVTTPPNTATEGQLYRYDMVGVMADDLDATLEYRFTAPAPAGVDTPPAGMLIDSASGRMTWDVPIGYPGPYNLNLQAEVSHMVLGLATTTVSQNIPITVNMNPTIDQVLLNLATTTTPITGTVPVNAGDSFSATVMASDVNAGDTLTYYLVSPPPGATIDTATGLVQWPTIENSATGGTYNVTLQVQVEDGNGGVALAPITLAVSSTAHVDTTTPPTGTVPVTIQVQEDTVDPATGLPTQVNNFRFLINVDNTPVVDPALVGCADLNNNGLADDCPSDKQYQSNTPPVAGGAVVAGVGNTVNLDPGRYFVSVLTNDGTVTGPDANNGGLHKLSGRAFTVDAAPVNVVVPVIAGPTPLSRIAVQVFEDTSPLNGTWDRLLEGPPTRNRQYDPNTGEYIPGTGTVDPFKIVINDAAGQVTQDYYGNPICSKYDNAGNLIPGTGGTCWTDATGFVSIENIAAGKYEVLAIPPKGSGWIQTTTIEGSKVIDSFVVEGNQGVLPVETAAIIFHGFVQPCAVGSCNSGLMARGTGTFYGKLSEVEPSRPPFTIPDGIAGPVPDPWLALNDANGKQVALVRGDAGGNFTIDGVPDGTYSLVAFDDSLDMIMATYTVTMPALLSNGIESRQVEVFDPRFGTGPGRSLMIPDWWGQLEGTIFLDWNENGVRDAGEEGLAGEALEVRQRDGSLQYATVTNSVGDYYLRRVFPFGHWLVMGVGYRTMAATGATVTAAAGLPNLGQPPVEVRTDLGPVLTMGYNVLEGGTNRVDWGKKPYPTVGNAAVGNDYVAINGGVSGVVWYNTTRSAFDVKNEGPEDWEPGIPNITLEMYETVIDPVTGQLETVPEMIEDPNNPGTMIPNPDPNAGAARKGRMIGRVQTDHYNAAPPANCEIQNLQPDGTVVATVEPECRDLLRTWNQVKPAAFDGGYQFFEDCRDDTSPDPNALYPADSGLCAPIAPGKYLIEVHVPEPYKLVTSNDANAFTADDTFGPNPYAEPVAPLLAPSGCVGPVYEVTRVIDPPNPLFGQFVNDCGMKVVTVTAANNGAADFHLFTDVPVPTRLRGFVNDNLNLEANGAFPNFGDKHGVPFVPVSIQDYKGNEIAHVYTDANGFFEVLLPSTQRVAAPTPSGVVPNMVVVYANHPGMSATVDPAFNPNYDTLRMQFELFPGKTSYADMALTPTNGFFANKNVVCLIDDPAQPATRTPQIAGVNDPLAGGGVVQIFGTGFGAIQGQGQVTLDGIPLAVTTWSDTAITAQMAAADGVTPIADGPRQLLVTADNLKVSPTGITIHKLGPAYNPHIEYVGGTALNPYPNETIQAAIDRSPYGTLLLVPGDVNTPTRYVGSPILYNGITLQGYGPGASQVVAEPFTPVSQVAWQNKLAEIITTKRAADELDQVHPTAGALATLTILARDLPNNPLPAGTPADPDPGVRVDGLQIEGARIGGGVHVNVFANGTNIGNNKVVNNYGVLTGGIALGFAGFPDNFIDGARVHHNMVVKNGTQGIAGGIGAYDGVSNYRIDHNLLCDNGSTTSGGGISHQATAGGVNMIDHNDVLFNWSLVDGGGLNIQGPPAGAVGVPSTGSGEVRIIDNRFQGNFSTEDGSAIALNQAASHPIEMTNNTIVNNVALGQGAIKVQDSLGVVMTHNTIAKNVTTSTAGSLLLDPGHHSAGLVVYRNSLPYQLLGGAVHSNPKVYNNLFWDNLSYVWNEANSAFEAPVPFDLSLYQLNGQLTNATHNLFSDQSLTQALQVSEPTLNYVGSGANWPLFVDPYDNAMTGVVVRAAGEVAINPLAVPVAVDFSPLAPLGDYHIMDGSPALQAGATDLTGVGVTLPVVDKDGEARPMQYCMDAGSDERMATITQHTCPEALAAISGYRVAGFEGSAIVQTISELGAGSWTWNYGDGSAAVSGTGAVVFNHTYADSGTYVATLTLILDGLVQQAAIYADVANVNPVVNAGPDVTTTVGQPAAFNATASDPSPVDQAALTYLWNFGDGTGRTTLQAATSHTYIVAGTYNATLTVTDPDGGATTDLVVVTVNAIGAGTVSGDVNGDGQVSSADYMMLMEQLGLCTGDAGFNAAADLSGDGCVTMADIGLWERNRVQN